MSTVLELQHARVDLQTGAVLRGDGARLSLTDVERRLLAFLAERPDQVVSRETLLQEVWELHPTTLTRAVDTAVRRLRKKVEQEPAKPRHVRTEHGLGYRFLPLSPPNGRECLIAWLLASEEPLITLVGPSGMGKTWVLEHAFSGPDVAWVTLEGCSDAETLWATFASQLERPMPRPGAKALLSGLRGRSTLVLDGVDGARALLAPLLQSVLAEAPELKVRVSAHAPLEVDPESVRAIEPLPPGPSLRLFETHAGGEHPMADELLPLLDGYPLALEIVGRWLRRAAWEGEKDLLEQLLPSLPSLHPGPARQQTLRAAVEVTLSRLDADARTLLQRLGTLQRPFTLRDLLLISGAPQAQTMASFAALQDAALLRAQDARWRVYPVVQACLNPTALDLEHHARFVETRAAELVGQVYRSPEALRAQQTLLPDLMLALRTLGPLCPERAARLSEDMCMSMLSQLPSDQMLAIYSRPWVKEVSPALQALLMARRAELLRIQGNTPAALETTRQAREQLGENSPLVMVEAMVAHGKQDRARAAALYQKVAEMDPAPRQQVIARIGLAYCHAPDPEDLPAALKELRAAQLLARSADIPMIEAVPLRLASHLESALGNHAVARADNAHALEIFEAFGDERYQADTHWNGGFIELNLGRLEQARAHFARALEMTELLQISLIDVLALTGLGQTAALAGDRDLALRHLDGAIHRARAQGVEMRAIPAMSWAAVLRHRAGEQALSQELIQHSEALAPAPVVVAAKALIAGAPLPESRDPDARLISRLQSA
ncbi:MAG: winged helix-turn-helix domain-containing protein [Myxococcota bacterium]|nr:winged helix-turn-helix domain-containing protein [Myxococcota bacterium]